MAVTREVLDQKAGVKDCAECDGRGVQVPSPSADAQAFRQSISLERQKVGQHDAMFSAVVNAVRS